MPTELIFIRHGQSTWNEARRWQGHSDPPLAANGRLQARLLARRLATWNIDFIYTSDLARAEETASILGEAINVRPMIDPIWRERGFGDLEGLTSEEIEARFPQVWASRMVGPMNGIPNAEPQDAVVSRATMGCTTLLERHAGKIVAIVSHGGMILTTIVHLLRLPPNGHALIGVGSNTSISRVIVDDHGARLIGLNDAAHLEQISS